MRLEMSCWATPPTLTSSTRAMATQTAILAPMAQATLAPMAQATLALMAQATAALMPQATAEATRAWSSSV